MPDAVEPPLDDMCTGEHPTGTSTATRARASSLVRITAERWGLVATGGFRILGGDAAAGSLTPPPTPHPLPDLVVVVGGSVLTPDRTPSGAWWPARRPPVRRPRRSGTTAGSSRRSCTPGEPGDYSDRDAARRVPSLLRMCADSIVLMRPRRAGRRDPGGGAATPRRRAAAPDAARLALARYVLTDHLDDLAGCRRRRAPSTSPGVVRPVQRARPARRRTLGRSGKGLAPPLARRPSTCPAARRRAPPGRGRCGDPRCCARRRSTC